MATAVVRSSILVKSMIGRLRGASHFTTSTTPKRKAFAPTVDHLAKHNDVTRRLKKGEALSAGVALGMITLSTSFGIYTATKELRTAPNVFVKKSRRETIPEVAEPEHVLQESEKFIKSSFFRKVAHLRDKFLHDQDSIDQPVPAPRVDIFSRPPKAETLKDVGVDPISHSSA